MKLDEIRRRFTPEGESAEILARRKAELIADLERFAPSGRSLAGGVLIAIESVRTPEELDLAEAMLPEDIRARLKALRTDRGAPVTEADWRLEDAVGALAEGRAAVLAPTAHVTHIRAGDSESLEALRDAAALDGLEAVGSETPNCATCGKHVKFPFHLINGSLYCSTDCSPPIGPGDVLSVFSGPGAFGSGGGSAEGSAGAEPGTFSGTTFGGGGAPGIRGVDYAERRVGDMVAAEAFALEEKTAEIAERLAGPIGTFARTMRSVEDAMAESLSGPFRKLAEGLDEMARADHDEKALRPSRRYVGKAVVSPNTESYHRPLALPRRT